MNKIQKSSRQYADQHKDTENMYLETLSDNFEHLLMPADDPDQIQSVNQTQELRNKVGQKAVGLDVSTTEQSDKNHRGPGAPDIYINTSVLDESKTSVHELPENNMKD